MVFESVHITGKGRGKPMGYPTINLRLPSGLKLKDGVYAAKVTIENKTFAGALHFGPVPTFDESEKSLEVYLIDVPEEKSIKERLENLDGKIIKVETVKYLRKVIKFRSVASLVNKINVDVHDIKKLLN